jgi:DNA-binding PadR family transcriptional regulator
MHGYEVITELSQRTEGAWQPSPGSIYPTLQLLEDEGLVQAETDGEGSRRRYSLTEEGRRAAALVTAQPLPWEQLRAPAGAKPLGLAVRALVGAVRQVFMTGNAKQQEQAVRVLEAARRELYSVLASGQAEPGGAGEGGGAGNPAGA